MKNIVLVWPFNHCYSPSLSLLYQAKILKQEGYDVNVIYSNLLFSHNNLSLPEEVKENPEQCFKEVILQVEKLEPDFVYLGSWREHAPFVDRFSKELKRRNPNLILINGGHNPTFVPEEVLTLTPEIDYLIRGEPEYVLKDLVKALSFGRSPANVKGISFRKQNQLCHTEQKSIDKLDKLPLIDFAELIGKFPSRIDIRTSRGCIMNCRFCNLYKMWPKPVRYHSTKYVIRQLKRLQKKYPSDYVHFIDEMFLCKLARAKTLVQNIKKEFPWLKWGAMIRNEFVTDKTISYLAKNGFCNTAVGIESINEKVLNFLNKTLNTHGYVSKINDTVKILKEKLEMLEIGLITGTPVENEKDIIDLINFVKTAKQDKGNLDVLRIALGRLVLYPGTQFWYDRKRFKMIKDEMNYNKYQTFFEKNYDNIFWAVPWNYLVKNNNFNNHQDYQNLLRMAFEVAER